MRNIYGLIGCSALFGMALMAGPAAASDNKIALIPGGPHPYFKPWEQAAADAKKDFGIASVDFKVPSDWKLSLQTELIESLVAQGYKGFGIFPGRRGRHQFDGVGVEGRRRSVHRSRRAARKIRPMSPFASARTSTIPPISARKS